MFEVPSQRLGNVSNRLGNKGRLAKKDVDEAV